MKNNAWLKFPIELLTREDITPLVKIVYTYMLQRYHFFVVERKQQYYETQEEISKNCNTGRKAAMVGTSVRALNVIMKCLLSIDERCPRCCPAGVKDRGTRLASG